MNVPISEEVAQHVMDEHEGYLDRLLTLYRDLKVRDVAEGANDDVGALGGMAMAIGVLGVPSVRIMLALAVRRLADQ